MAGTQGLVTYDLPGCARSRELREVWNPVSGVWGGGLPSSVGTSWLNASLQEVGWGVGAGALRGQPCVELGSLLVTVCLLNLLKAGRR